MSTDHSNYPPDEDAPLGNTVKRWKIIAGVLTAALVLMAVVSVGTVWVAFSDKAPNDGQNDGKGGLTESMHDLREKIIPTGTPKVYGAELEVSYDDVSPQNLARANRTIKKMADIDRARKLTGKEQKRYQDILYHQYDGISCEYCCDARAVIFQNGSAACGCEHSFAMRGLTKQLITEYGDKMSDEEILTEIGKWKVLFFPDNHLQKAKAMQERGIELDYISLTTNSNRGIEQGGSGDMVGGC